MNILGLDIGGTKIFAGRYDQNHHLETSTKLKTDAQLNKEATLAHILEAIAAVQNEETQAIGIAWAGFVNGQTGQIIKAPNIPSLDGFMLTDFITEKTGLPCVLENDARCFALGEYLACDPRPKNCLGLILGTGVGSGLVVNGEIFQGAHFSAGEVGHMMINGEEVEAQIAGPGLQAHFGVDKLTHLEAIDPAQLAPKMEVFIDWLYSLLLAYDPDKIIIGGGAGIHFWSKFQTEIIDILNKKIEQYPITFELTFSDRKNAGAEGAAWLAKEGLEPGF